MADRKRINKVLKEAGVSADGRWAASGRVKGWGTWLSGVRIEAVQTFDAKAGGMIRTKTGWKRDWEGNIVRRGAWINTGAFTLDWCSGEHDTEDTYGELAKAVKALRAAGFSVIRTYGDSDDSEVAKYEIR